MRHTIRYINTIQKTDPKNIVNSTTGTKSITVQSRKASWAKQI